MNSRACRVVIYSVLMLLAGIATPQDEESDATSNSDATDPKVTVRENCFRMGSVTDINVIDDQHAYIRTRGANHFLVTLARVCKNLLVSYRRDLVSIHNIGSRVCPNDGTYLLYESLGRPAVCPFMFIQQVDSRTHARAMAESIGSPVEAEPVILPEE